MDLAHNMCRTLPMSDRLWKANQGMKCLPKIRTCMWRLLLRSYVRRHVINITERCPYWVELESIEHMVLRCAWVKPFQFATFGIWMENRQPLFVSSWVKTISFDHILPKEDKERHRGFCRIVSLVIWTERCRAMSKRMPQPPCDSNGKLCNFTNSWRFQGRNQSREVWNLVDEVKKCAPTRMWEPSKQTTIHLGMRQLELVATPWW